MKGRGAAGLLAAALLLGPPGLAAQSADVRGTVVDSSAAPVDGAMVVALTLPDSVLATYDLSDGDGRFELSDLPPGSFLLQVTRVGFHTLYRPFTTEGMQLDVGTVRLQVAAEEIDPLTISVERVPFLARGDTLAYNALAFFTRPNASVEDLLRQLPGIEVELRDKNGLGINNQSGVEILFVQGERTLRSECFRDMYKGPGIYLCAVNGLGPITQDSISVLEFDGTDGGSIDIDFAGFWNEIQKRQ